MSLHVTSSPLAALAAWFGADAQGAGLAQGPAPRPAGGEAPAAAATPGPATTTALPTPPTSPTAAAPPAWGRTEPGELSQPMPLAAAPSTSSSAPELAAPPLTPAWVGSLQTPSAFAPGWPRAPRPEREPRRRPPPAEDPWDETLPTDAPAPAASGDTAAACPAPALPAGLPERVRAELQRRRSVLLLAPLRMASSPSPLAGWWLGVDAQGQARVRRCALVGEAPPAGGWRYWHAHRDDTPARLAARADAPGQPALQLRLATEGLPPALRGPAEAWADLLEPGLARRCLGLQWTWLVACAPSPPPWA